MNRGGLTVLELMVALTVSALTATAAHLLLRRGITLYRSQQQALEAGQAVRMALSVLPLELGELDASDPGGGDILEMASSSIAYRSPVNLYFVCRPPDSASAAVTVSATRWFGIQPLAPGEHVVLILTDGDPKSPGETWQSHGVRSATPGRDCPGGRSSLSLNLAPVSGAGQHLSSIPSGSPVRGYRLSSLNLYRDAEGFSWLGMRTAGPTGGWGTTQPVLGPLANAGFRLSYFDAAGSPVSKPAEVERIGIRVVGGSRDVRVGVGPVVTGEIDVWLRNNRRL